MNIKQTYNNKAPHVSPSSERRQPLALTLTVLTAAALVLLLSMMPGRAQATEQQVFSIGGAATGFDESNGYGLPQLDDKIHAGLSCQLDMQSRLPDMESDAVPAGTTRVEMLARHQSPLGGSQSAKAAASSDAAQFSNPIYHEFAIYEASSRLFVDEDYDGFYQTFSVTFDADVYGPDIIERASVYAELYWSRDGGPWIHYYTTDIFTIFGDSSGDDFEVLTTLHSGYRADYYDVLIDLYEVGFDDIVATFSSDDSNELYGLPLESSDRDSVDYGDSSSEGAGGAISFWGLLMLGLLGLSRNRRFSL